MPGRRVPIRAGARSAATANGNTAAMTAAGTVTTATIATIAMAGVVTTIVATATVAAGMTMIAAGAMAAIERHRTKISCIKQLRRTGAATRCASLALSYAGLL